MRIQKTFSFLVFITLLMTSCSGIGNPDVVNDDLSTQQTEAETTAEPVKVLTICVGEAVEALDPLNARTTLERDLSNLLFPVPVVVNDFSFEANALHVLPSADLGTVRVENVTVSPGETALGADGRVRALVPGMRVYPAGCQSADCAVAFDGTSLVMDQLVVDFALRQDLVWSDGSPVRAGDSVFHFELLARSEDAPPDVARTASYLAEGEFEVVWRGVPGYLPADYSAQLFAPLPSHLWNGQAMDSINAQSSDLINLPAYGPYVVREASSEQIVFAANPFYTDSLFFGEVIVKVVRENGSENLEMLRTRACDVLGPLASAGQTATEGINAYRAPSGAWHVLNMGIVPHSYDNGYNQLGGDRPDFFSDMRVRQAIGLCIDREGLADIFGGHAMVSYSPLLDDDGLHLDPVAAGSLLEDAGWRLGEDGLRAAAGIGNVVDGTRFAVRLHALNTDDSLALANRIGDDLSACGIAVEVTPLPGEPLYTTGEQAPLFGRNFDLALLAWNFDPRLEPSCQLFLGEAIPGADLSAFTYGWGGWNLTGWQNGDFDTACTAARSSLPGFDGYEEGHTGAGLIFGEQLPAIPLFYEQSSMLIRADLCGLQFTPSGFAWSAADWADCE
jgi:peptide/nickel transport system substrate-binding protein